MKQRNPALQALLRKQRQLKKLESDRNNAAHKFAAAIREQEITLKQQELRK